MIVKFPTAGSPGQEFRTLPYPLDERIKTSTFWVRVSDLPKDLVDFNWINPRVVDERGPIMRALVASLTGPEPEWFGLKNRGLTVLARLATFNPKTRQVELVLIDPDMHGLVDGGHSGKASINHRDTNAVIKMHVTTGITDLAMIAEIAGGLNTSSQVDAKSLLALAGYFKSTAAVLAGETYAERIGYKQNDIVYEAHEVEGRNGPRRVIDKRKIPVTEILYYAKVLDGSTYSETAHPVALFGRKEGILREFRDQVKTQDRARKIEAGELPPETDEDGNIIELPVSYSFQVLISRLPEILRLRDQIEKAVASHDLVGRYKAGRRKGQRIRGAGAGPTELVFLGEEIPQAGINLGWLLPMLGGFRANVIWPTNGQGTFTWTMDPEVLLPAALDRLVTSILAIHEQENARAEYVGRNRLSWSVCYDAVRTTLLEMQLKSQSQQIKGLKAKTA